MGKKNWQLFERRSITITGLRSKYLKFTCYNKNFAFNTASFSSSNACQTVPKCQSFFFFISSNFFSPCCNTASRFPICCCALSALHNFHHSLVQLLMCLWQCPSPCRIYRIGDPRHGISNHGDYSMNSCADGASAGFIFFNNIKTQRQRAI